MIRVVSFNGRPLGHELMARFGEDGGSIGRGENTTLVLPDPERFISRIHASISFQAGGYVITDNSTKNPTAVNGRPMGPGTQERLRDGDQIQLGGYMLAVELATLSTPDVPAAEMRAAEASVLPKDDPWAMFKGSQPNAPDPFADLLKPKRPAPPPLPPEPAIPPTASSARPDPLASLKGREPSIDDVLGLKQSGVPDLLGPELRPTRSAERAGGRGIVDPLEALGGAPRPLPPPTASDHGEELFTPYAPPVAKRDPALEPKPEAARAVTPPPIGPPVSTPHASSTVHRDPAPIPVVEAPAPPAPPITVEPPARPAPGAQDATLLHALLAGAGIPDAHRVKSLTPETMENIGKLLREVVQGTLDLLRARGLTKSEIRADVTMIMPMDNNPLKFSPTVEAAMMHLLAPPAQGFMPPVRAMKNAYDDLRAHELGVLAGMRAALDEVLARFAPEELKKRLSDKTVLDSLLPLNRKAKQWDLFVDRYQTVAEEAREDFHTAFGKAFRRAYEAQVKQLRAEER